MHSWASISLIFLVFTCRSIPQALSVPQSAISAEPTSPFSIALSTLQSKLNYKFGNVELLRRAMTHASYSEENNKALSILGESVIETVMGLNLLGDNVDISPKDMRQSIDVVSKVETACATYGMRLGLQDVVRVSAKTDSSKPVIVCGAFRAIFGAMAVDTMSSDAAGKVFLRIHGGEKGRSFAM